MKAISCKLSAISLRITLLRIGAVMLTAYSLQLTAISYANETALSSTELIERAKELDGKTVLYRGEAVTAVLNRGEYSWINLNDGRNAIGIWIRASDAGIIAFVGDYKHRGDSLEVEGTFNRACSLHKGEMDIHASVVRITEKGTLLPERIDRRKIVLSVVFFSLVLVLALIFRKKI